MSEVINIRDTRATIRWKLLTGASALALTAYVASSALANAEDSDRPTLWIELGGQMEVMQGLGSPFTAPFMTAVTPTPDVYKGGSFASDQRPPRFAFGAESTITFQPEGSDWVFSAGIRYGRSHGRSHLHHQTPGQNAPFYTYASHHVYNTVFISTAAFLDVTAPYNEHHMVLDFSVGRDVGIGLLGRDGSSSASAGVRLVDFSVNSNPTIFARPSIGIVYPGPKYTAPQATFHAYTMTAHADRSFKGAGPSLSWNASAAVAGNKQDGELMLDWGLNAALLFGRQKAKTDHSTQASQRYVTQHTFYGYVTGYSVKFEPLYAPNVHNNPSRSRKVTVPNIGGFAGLSWKWSNAKVSVGYRYDTFLNAMDTGIDVAKKSNLTFQGPYASISIGLGD